MVFLWIRVDVLLLLLSKEFQKRLLNDERMHLCEESEIFVTAAEVEVFLALLFRHFHWLFIDQYFLHLFVIFFLVQSYPVFQLSKHLQYSILLLCTPLLFVLFLPPILLQNIFIKLSLPSFHALQYFLGLRKW